MKPTGSGGRWGGRGVRIAVGFGLLAAAMVGAVGAIEAQSPAPSPAPFVDVADAALDQARDAAESPSAGGPERSRSLLLNRDAMESVLANAPDGRDGAGSLVLELPAPDGTMMAFDVWINAVMAPELAAAFPEITTYSGQGVDERAATIAFDLTPQGFHAQVLSPSGNWYIDPAIRLADTFHESFFRSDIGTSAAGAFIEENAAEIDELAADRPDAPVASRSGSQLRTHRLAVSATSAYTALFGNQAAAQSAIVTTINRVNGIYETELAVGLQLVGNNTSVVYESVSGSCVGTAHSITGASFGGAGISEVHIVTSTGHGLSAGDVVKIAGSGTVDGTWAVRSVVNPNEFELRGSFFSTAPSSGAAQEWDPTAGKDCDPFNNTSADINVNQAVVDQVIGDANYDIGHVFTTTLGGVAGLGVVGISGQKARGLTGLSTLGELTSDEFYVDFVAHEMGHQYGGSHTFNGDLNNCAASNWGGTANSFEPGSGSTIQAYAGICGDDNLQVGGQGQSGDGTNASDPYFHSRSFDQIQAHVAVYPGTTTATGNNVPSVNAGADITIPAQTPFFLGATGTDADGGDVLTYNFEQRDQGAHSFLNTPEINVVGPLFRSFQPSLDDTSFFPRLSDLADGSTNQNAACPTLTGSEKNAADCWSQFLIQTGGGNSIALNDQRDMNFRATARDNRAGGGGVDTDEMKVTVRNTGAKFRVTDPIGPFLGGAPLIVTWDEASTSAAPINASTVSVRLSRDGGLTYPTVLASNVPNDGSQPVTVTSDITTQGRIMVHSGTYRGGSGFLDISDIDFLVSTNGATVPSPPIDPSGTPGNGSVMVSWSPPDGDGGSAIIGYTVTATPGGNTCSTTGALGCTVTGLTNDVSYTFAVTASNSAGPSPAANTPPVTPLIPKFTPVTQQRLEDTRDDPTPKYGSNTPDDTFTFNVYNYPGVLPSAGIEAVSLNVTVDQGEQPPIGGGFATIYNCGSRPTASNINFSTNKPTPNAVITPVSPTGDVCVYVYGAASLLIDVNGYFPTGSDFDPVPQQRLEDTRPAKLGSNTAIDTYMFNVLGRAGLPASGVGAVSLNVTVDQGEQPPIGGGFATVWNCVTGRPTASNLNFSTNKPVPNAVITPVSPSGDVCVYVYGAASLLVDVNGYFPTGSDFTPVPQQRLEDTRPTGKIGNAAGTGAPFMFNVLGRAGLPVSGVGAVSLNVTADRGEQPTIGGGFVTVYNCGVLPTASNLNFSTSKPAPNAVITPVSPTGDVCVYVYGTADILVDINGYFPD